MQNRIDRLEGLVLSLMTSGSQSGSTAVAQAAIHTSRSDSISTTSDTKLDSGSINMITEEPDGTEEESEVEGIAHRLGIMKMDGNKTVFASDGHWYAILGEIAEVKKYFENHKEDYKKQMARVQASKSHESPGTAFLLQGGPPIRDKAELLASFPPKAESDRLIARYFNAYDPSVHIIHGPSFQKQYDNHWLNPNDTAIIWLGMCFAMMTLALQSYQRAGDEPPEYRGRSLDLSHYYRRLTAQCLILGDITQPLAQTLETLVLHVQSEYGRSTDSEPGVLLITSLCVRLAMRMGYHRDPAPYSGITPFQAEMRRRVWTFVRQADLLISFQFGLPAMIKTDVMDTQSPRNLYDDELHEDLKSLPPSRPSWEATPMTYMITKSKMTLLFGRVVERVQSVTDPPSYEETLKFDGDLRELRAQHPPLLRMRSFHESARDPANLIMQRFGLEMTYLRTLFVLHRRFVARGREIARYAYSRRTCLDASMELLQHQVTLHQEAQPGGRLRSVKWYISSLTTHDFLIAAMMVCLDLHRTAEAERKARNSGTSPAPLISGLYDEGRREEMLRAVEGSIKIWESVRDYSMEAYKGSNALRVMVDKLKAHQILQQSAQQSNSPQQQRQSNVFMTRGQYGVFPDGTVSDLNVDDLPPEQSAAMTLGLLSSGGMSPGSGFSPMNMNMNGGGGGGDKQSYPASMAALLNDPMSERTGLTPNYSGPEMGDMNGGVPMPGGAASPLTQILNQGPNFMGTDGMGGDIDWVCLLFSPTGFLSCFPFFFPLNISCRLTIFVNRLRGNPTFTAPATAEWTPARCGP